MIVATTAELTLGGLELSMRYNPDSPPARLMKSRVERGACAFCGTTLSEPTFASRGRVCQVCIDPDSAGVRSMAGHRPSPEDAKSSYWLLEGYFGPFPLLDSLPPAPMPTPLDGA